MKIRQATRSDIKSISEIAIKTYVEAFGSDYTQKELKHRLTKRSVDFYTQVFDKDTILLAEEDGKIIGFVQYGDVTFQYDAVSKADQELQRLYVLSSYQNRGIGKALIEASFQDSRLFKAPKVFIEVGDENLKAQKLYKEYGFKELAKINKNLILVRLG